jgi:hypothetical protein
LEFRTPSRLQGGQRFQSHLEQSLAHRILLFLDGGASLFASPIEGVGSGGRRN